MTINTIIVVYYHANKAVSHHYGQAECISLFDIYSDVAVEETLTDYLIAEMHLLICRAREYIYVQVSLHCSSPYQSLMGCGPTKGSILLQ